MTLFPYAEEGASLGIPSISFAVPDVAGAVVSHVYASTSGPGFQCLIWSHARSLRRQRLYDLKRHYCLGERMTTLLAPLTIETIFLVIFYLSLCSWMRQNRHTTKI